MRSVVAGLLLLAVWLQPAFPGPTPVVMQEVICILALCFAFWVVRSSQSKLSTTFMVAGVWAAVASALIGLTQYFGYADGLQPWDAWAGKGQAFANLRQRNQLATLLAMGLSAWLWWQQQYIPSNPTALKRLGLVALSWLSLALLATAAAATGSRTGLLQWGLLAGLAFMWRRGRRVTLVALLIYGVAAFLLPLAANLDPAHSGILGRASEAPAGCSSRLVLWSNVLHLIAQKPWLGWGWGELDYAHFTTLYSGERFCEIMGNAHNLPLHLAVELGVPLALAFCGTVVWLVLRAKPWREQNATRQLAWSVLAVIGLHSLLEYPLWYGPFQLATVLAIWMLWTTQPSQSSISQDLTVKKSLVHWPIALAFTAILAGSYAAWDYWRISQIYLSASQRAQAYREDTLAKISDSWLFRDQVRFAELGITPLTASNAEHIHALATDLLHFSPETMVVEKLIESASLLGKDDEVAYFIPRYRAAYPQDFARWSQANASGAGHKTP